MTAPLQHARRHAEAVRSTGVTVPSGLLPVRLIDTLGDQEELLEEEQTAMPPAVRDTA